MEDSSYSPSDHSSSQIVECSQVSLRSVGSQMSISSAGSASRVSILKKRKHKVFGSQAQRRQMGKMRLVRKLKFPKVPATIIPESNSNIVVNLAVFQQVLDSMAKCLVCDGRLELIETGTSSGCASYLALKCTVCDSEKKFWTVSNYSHGKIDLATSQIPKRNSMVFTSVLAGRLMGVGWHKLFLYHSMLNIPGPATSRNFGRVQTDILLAAEDTAAESMLIARDQLRALQNVDTNCSHVTTVGTFDGAYQQRSGKSGGGFSRYCFAAAIIAQTGKVISYGLACNSCAVCNRISNRLLSKVITEEECEQQMLIHKPNCPAEYKGLSSVHLESAIAPKVISDALERGVIFSAIVSDGDNKTHDVLAKADIYKGISGTPSIRRFECIAHVAKRMKSNLFKKQDKVLKLARADKSAESREMSKEGISHSQIKKVLDPKYRGQLQRSSKSRDAWKSGPSQEIKHLSLSMCGQIASYYRLAVQRNSGDIPSILNGIKAIVLHLSANDENAEMHHQFCPFTSNSWCRFQSAKFNGEPVPSHPNYLGEEATKLILDLFDDFGYNTAAFVEKVSTGLSSNHNESLHNLLFTMTPKTEAIGMDVMKLSSALAIIRYNEGFEGIVRLLTKLDVEVTKRMRNAFNHLDSSRARQKVKIVSEQQKRYRKKQLRGRAQSKQKSKHGPGYASGSYSSAKSSKPISDNSSEEELETDILPVLSPAICPLIPTSSDAESCPVCHGTEENRLVGIGLSMRMVDIEIEWVQCQNCDRWYHLLCLDTEDPEDIGEVWYCTDC